MGPGGPPLLQVRDAGRGELTLDDGGTVMLLGPSGAGKTVWLRSLIGVGEPFEHVELLGRHASHAAMTAAVGWVPEGDGVFLSETVLDNVTAARLGVPSSDADSVDALDLLGLADRAAEPVGNLGWGGRRRVALARALAHRRPLLVIDGGLDATLWPFLPVLRAHLPWLRGMLLSSCAADEMAWKADSTALVVGGRVVSQAPLATLADSPDPDVRRLCNLLMP